MIKELFTVRLSFFQTIAIGVIYLPTEKNYVVPRTLDKETPKFYPSGQIKCGIKSTNKKER